MKARFPGDCRICKKPILLGQDIILMGRAVHAKCVKEGVKQLSKPPVKRSYHPDA